MKKIVLKLFSGLFLGALVGAYFAPAFALAQANPGERIDGFYEAAHINTDATVSVSERIVYNFGTNNDHGIYRDIPEKYQTSVGTISTNISNIKVTDEQGSPYDFSTSKKGNDIEIKIGDPNYTVTGIHTYVISYTIARTIGYFNNYDEWYWNVTGNEWQVPIGQVEVMVYLPTPIPGNQLQFSCYEGVEGSTDSCGSQGTTSAQTIQSVEFTTNKPLNPGEELTIAVGFPKGIVYQPTWKENLIYLIQNNWIVALPIIVFLFMLNVWWRKGKDPKGRGTIIPEYDAPDNITPLEMSMMLHQAPRDIPAEIIYLAT